MKPIIGIVARNENTIENNKMLGVYEELSTAIKISGGIPIGILPNVDIKNQLKLIDGIIFQGGDDFTEYEQEILLEAYKNNINTLGICLGMQLIGNCFNEQLIPINKHKYKGMEYVHSIDIDKSSILYDIFKSNIIMVNSRHNFALQKPLKSSTLSISAVSNDGVIEAVEDKNKNFFLGVQWHPESMIDYDENQRKLFIYFVNKCRGDL